MSIMKNQKRILIAFLCFSAFMLHAADAGGKSYYVSAAAADGDGTREHPFRSIQVAASLARGGDTVFVSGGFYVLDDVKPGNSGSEGRYVVFQAQPGTGEAVLQHPDTSPGGYSAVFDLSGMRYVWLEGFTFRDFKYARCAVAMEGSEGCVVSRCRFEQLGHPEVSAWNANSVIWMGNARRNAVVDNVFEDIIGDGVSLNGQECTGNMVAHNSFFRFSGKKRSWGGENLYTRCVDVQDMSDGDNLVVSNYFSEVRTCIWLDRDGSRNVILRNRAHDCGDFVFNESRCAGNVVAENIGDNLEGIGYQTARYATGWTEDAQWTNNVAYRCETGFFVHKSRRDRMRGNIVYDCSGYNIEFSDSAYGAGPHLFVDNIVYTPGNTKSVVLCGREVMLRTFQSRLDGEGNLEGSPGFVSTACGEEDFTLRENSRAKGMGYGGVDVGAYPVYGPGSVGAAGQDVPVPVQAGFDRYVVRMDRDAEVAFTVRLSRPCAEELGLALQPVAGEAREGEDFLLSTGELVFAPGETVKRFTMAGMGLSPYDELLALHLVPNVGEAGASCGYVVVQIRKNTEGEPESVAGNLRDAGDCRIVYDSGRGTLAVGWQDGEAAVCIYSHDGQMVHQARATGGSYNYDMGGMPRGFYIVRVQSSDGQASKIVAKE